MHFPRPMYVLFMSFCKSHSSFFLTSRWLLTTLTLNMAVFRVVAPYSLLENYRRHTLEQLKNNLLINKYRLQWRQSTLRQIRSAAMKAELTLFGIHKLRYGRLHWACPGCFAVLHIAGRTRVSSSCPHPITWLPTHRTQKQTMCGVDAPVTVTNWNTAAMYRLHLVVTSHMVNLQRVHPGSSE
jgi:hypothetical protein